MPAVFDRLTPFEAFMHSSHRPHQPMTIYTRLHFRDPVDLEQLQSSLNQVMGRHPLLNARIVKRGFVPCWQKLISEPLTIEPSSLREIFNRPSIDLREERGIRAWYIPTGDEKGPTEIWLEIHHACLDGLAILQLIREWREADLNLDQGAAASSSPEIGFGKEVLKQFRNRAEEKLGWISSRQLNRIIRFYFAKNIVRLQDQEQKTQYNRKTLLCRLPGILERVTERNSLPNKEGTFNDILLASTYAALFRLDVEKSPEDSLRVGVPVSTRDLSTQPDVVANCVTMTFLDQIRQDDMSDEKRLKLFRTIVQETGEVKEHRLYLSLLKVLKAAYPWHYMPNSLCAASMILSNLGRLGHYLEGDFSWGGNRLEGIDFLPPIRESVNLSIGAVGYESDLHLACFYNGDYLSDRAANQFCHLLEEELNTLLTLLMSPRRQSKE